MLPCGARSRAFLISRDKACQKIDNARKIPAMTTDNPNRESDERRLRELTQRYPKLFRGLVVPWYAPESWLKMRAAAVDGEKLHDSFAEFERASDARLKDVTSAGHPVEKVEIDVDALIAWCEAEARPLDSMARQEFAMRTLIERDRKAGHA
jgi:hypothetical protein